MAQETSCSRFTQRCRKATIYTETTPDCCKGGVIEVFKYIQQLFKEHDITWWMDYGSLLGTLRHNGFIPHDKDGDIGVLMEDKEKVLALRSQIVKDKFHFMYNPRRVGPQFTFAGGNRVKIRWSAVNNANVDIFFWYLDEETGLYHRTNYIMVDRFKGREFPKEWLLPLREAQFEDMTVPIPYEAEKLVVHRYGEGWKTPIAANNDGKRRGKYIAK